MRLDWRGALGLALSAGLLWWTLRDVDLASVASHLRDANLFLLLLSAALATACLAVRVPRWKTILAPIDEHVGFGPLWRATAIGTMVNNVVPARVGEIARAFALSRERPSIPFSAAFASLAVDRVFDAVAVMLLMALAIADPAFPRGSGDVTTRVANTIGFGTVFAVILLAVLYLLVFLPERIIGLYERVTRRLAPALEARGRDALLAFASGLGVLRHPLRFAAVLAWTLAFWMLNALAFWIGFRAVGIHVSYTAALLVQGVIVVGVAIPQAPGFWGVFEAAAKFALVDVYGVPAGQAVSWAIGFHLLSFLPITLIGAWYFARLGLHFRELGAAQGSGETGSPGRGRAA